MKYNDTRETCTGGVCLVCTLPFTLTGRVMEGKHLGRSIGFPTANLSYEPSAGPWPPEGVYIATVLIEGENHPHTAILNQGRHPTAPEGAPTVEAHLLDAPGQSLYGKQLTLTYRQFLRPETAFASLEDLKNQLQKDRQAALLWHTQHLLKGEC